MSILEKTKNDSPEAGGEAIKFVKPGDAIVAQFKSRKTGVKTKMSTSDTDLANVTNVLIVDSTIQGIKPGTVGSIWEGMHVRQLMDEAKLSAGTGFVLRFAETKNRFKKFFFKVLNSAELEAEAKEKGVTLQEVGF